MQRRPGKDKGTAGCRRSKGPFTSYLLLYWWPKDDALNGKWTAPPLKRVE